MRTSFSLPPTRFRERHRELERDADGGEILVGRRTARPFRIQHRERAGQRSTGQMVVGDDHVDPRRLQVRDRRMRARSAVAGHDQRGAGGLRGAHARRAQVVAVRETMRNERHRRATERAQRAHHQRGGTDAVDVVVAVNENRLTGAHRSRQTLDGTIEIGQAFRLVQMVEPRAKECLRVIGLAQSARGEQAANGPRQMQFLLQPLDRRSIRLGRKKPARPRAVAHGSGSHARKLDSASPPNNHQSTAYNITPQPSQISVAPEPLI